jgi:hypothetical protein
MLSLDLTRQLGEVRVIPRCRSTWELLEIALAGGADRGVMGTRCYEGFDAHSSRGEPLGNYWCRAMQLFTGSTFDPVNHTGVDFVSLAVTHWV